MAKEENCHDLFFVFFHYCRKTDPQSHENEACDEVVDVCWARIRKHVDSFIAQEDKDSQRKALF